MDVDALILKMIEKLVDARRNYRFTTTLGITTKVHMVHFETLRLLNSKITGLSAYSIAGNFVSLIVY